MKMQNTPLVQKLILVMLVLIFGCLVLMLVNGRKQIESLREGPPISTSVSSTNDDASVRPAYPSMRSSKPRGTTVAPEPAQRELSTVDGRTAQNFEAPAVIQQQPQILPTAAVIQSPETQSAEPGISGRVVLVGMPPQEIPIRFDATCGQLHPTETTTRRFVVSPDGGLANAFVYISKGLEGKTFATRTNTVFIDQTNCMYQPYIVGAMVNQPIEIRNSDPVLHNLHALPRNSDEFNFAQPLQGQIDQRPFRKPELFVKMKCDVHEWMLCYVTVLSHPYFAVTDIDGTFQLPSGLPPGRYEVTVAHLKAGSTSQTIVLKKGASARLQFRLPVNGKLSLALKAP